jgi:hypothetical protein
MSPGFYRAAGLRHGGLHGGAGLALVASAVTDVTVTDTATPLVSSAMVASLLLTACAWRGSGSTPKFGEELPETSKRER